MSARIEDYALIGDLETAALVCRDGSIDWLCLPRFDSGACFAALLGTPENGRWLLTPCSPIRSVRRQYRDATLVLETEFETEEGTVALIDCMPVRTERPVLLRRLEGRYGRVPMRLELIIRFDYGWVVPWVTHVEKGIRAIAGPNAVFIHSDVELKGENLTTVAEFTVAAGQQLNFALSWYPSYKEPSELGDALESIQQTEAWWREWVGQCTYRGPYRDAVLRSAITLKALTSAPTGGIVAAATTSLPEQLGGVRNWDYRYCWVRDATFTLYALLAAGFHDEARAWRKWLLRAAAGSPADLQIMYGISGERRLTEFEIPWLSGYDKSRPVRVGNAASNQFQLDVYGEVVDAMYQARRFGLEPEQAGWNLEKILLHFLETAWEQPDEGIWEVRGPRRHFTHSKVMAWVAFDRAVKAAENFQLECPADRWATLRDQIHDQVCREGFSRKRNSFVQYFGSDRLDASLLMIPLVGFLPPTDPRVRGTVEAIERDLLHDGFVARYDTSSSVDGLPPGEGAFLACTFWLADCLDLVGRHDDAVGTFERLLSLRNDVGLLAEEYDPKARRLVGNFPQAFSHIGLVNTALNLSKGVGPAEHRLKS